MGKAMMVAVALALAACESSPGYAPPQQQMDPQARALMFYYGMQQLQQSMTPPAMVAPAAPQAITCYPWGGGVVRCQ